jgi:hypothetical protein
MPQLDRHVYYFGLAGRWLGAMRDVLGGRRRARRDGEPRPAGAAGSISARLHRYVSRHLPPGLPEVSRHLKQLDRPADGSATQAPLLVSVRSGASLTGDDDPQPWSQRRHRAGLITGSGNARFAYSCRRFVQMRRRGLRLGKAFGASSKP